MSLPSAPLGKNGPLVPRLGLGLMNNSGVYNTAGSDEERFALMDKAYELGERFWDSADAYLDSEDLIGRWFAAHPERRKDIFLATKFGIQSAGSPPRMSINSSPEYCRQALERSLARLGTDYIDLYYVHRVDGTTPVEQTMRVLAEFVRAGRIRHIGLSACSSTTLRRAYAVHPIACVQMDYSVFFTGIEADPRVDPARAVLATARELGVAIVAYSPLGRGLLAGAVRTGSDVSGEGDMRRTYGLPWFQEGNLERNLALVAQLEALAAARGISVAQLCLAWVLAQGIDVFAIPGTRRVARLEENLAVLGLTLSAADEQAARALGAQVAGDHTPDAHAAQDFGETPEDK